MKRCIVSSKSFVSEGQCPSVRHAPQEVVLRYALALEKGGLENDMVQHHKLLEHSFPVVVETPCLRHSFRISMIERGCDSVEHLTVTDG